MIVIVMLSISLIGSDSITVTARLMIVTGSSRLPRENPPRPAAEEDRKDPHG